MHAKEYRDYRGFEGKRVFLLGIGNSALDIAIELANIAKRVINMQEAIAQNPRGNYHYARLIMPQN
jgi:cation diffusion facilitator CzcD-associated flavoprotein CzcO